MSAAPSIWIEEKEFSERLSMLLLETTFDPDFVTGPGRSGSVAAVYASYILGRPFIPYGATPPGRKILVVDTASMSGRTIRKAVSKYERQGYETVGLVAYESDDRHHFWYERLAALRSARVQNRIAA